MSSRLRRAACAAAAVALAASLAAAGATAASAEGSMGSLGSLGGINLGSTGSLGNSDTGSIGIGTNAPTLVTTQDGNKVSIEVKNPDSYLGLCTPVSLEAAQAVRLLGDPGAILSGGPGIHLYAPPIPLISNKWTATLPDGVYVNAGICAGVGTAGLADIALQVMVVPTGFGSLTSSADLGSAIGSLGLDVLTGSATGSSS